MLLRTVMCLAHAGHVQLWKAQVMHADGTKNQAWKLIWSLPCPGKVNHLNRLPITFWKKEAGGATNEAGHFHVASAV